MGLLRNRANPPNLIRPKPFLRRPAPPSLIFTPIFTQIHQCNPIITQVRPALLAHQPTTEPKEITSISSTPRRLHRPPSYHTIHNRYTGIYPACNRHSGMFTYSALHFTYSEPR